MPTKNDLIIFSKRLNLALDMAKVQPKGQGRQAAVAEMFGVSQKGARRWLEAEAFPDISRLHQIVKKLRVSLDWLLSSDSNAQAFETIDIANEIPLISWHSVLDWREGNNEAVDTVQVSGINISQESFAVRMEGSSMEPLFPEGCLLIIDPQKHQINRNYGLVFLHEEKRLTFKQILIDAEKTYLKSISPDFVGVAPMLLTKDDIMLGMLVQSRLDFLS